MWLEEDILISNIAKKGETFQPKHTPNLLLHLLPAMMENTPDLPDLRVQK